MKLILILLLIFSMPTFADYSEEYMAPVDNKSWGGACGV